MLEEAASQTIFSLGAQVPLPEARDDSEPPVLDGGMAIRGSIRDMCLVRKLTSAGAVLHADFDLEVDERLNLELASGQRLEGVVAWRSGLEVGLRFDSPLDVFAVIARNMVSMPSERRRMPRIELQCGACIESDTGIEVTTTRDISHGGVKVETSLSLEVDDRVRITLDGLDPLDGLVRWVKDGFAGIAFEPEPGWQRMMPWLKEMRSLAALAPEPSPPAPPAAADSRLALAPLGSPEEGSVHLNIPARVREGIRRWSIEVKSLTAHGIEFESVSAMKVGALLWVLLPGLEGWSARITKIEGYCFTCAFTHPLHPLVLERILAAANGNGKQ